MLPEDQPGATIRYEHGVGAVNPLILKDYCSAYRPRRENLFKDTRPQAGLLTDRSIDLEGQKERRRIPPCVSPPPRGRRLSNVFKLYEPFLFW